MICVAISEKDLDRCPNILKQVELAEIRIDLTGFDADEVRKACSMQTPVVATCRAEHTGALRQMELLTTAVESGARYIDIEIEAGKRQIAQLRHIAHDHGCRVIVSYHNFTETPSTSSLKRIINKCFTLGADVAKLAVMAKSRSDAVRILSLYETEKPLIALGMGEAGIITRIMAPLLGAEFTFASADEGSPTAPGQIRYAEMKAILDLIRHTAST